MLKVFLTSAFRKEYKLMKKRGYDMTLLKELIIKLSQEQPLEPKYKDHALSGNFVGLRECHIKPDWLLIYKIESDKLILVLSQTGTHANLFGK